MKDTKCQTNNEMSKFKYSLIKYNKILIIISAK